MTRAICLEVPLWGVLCSDSSRAFARSFRNRRSSRRFLSLNSFRCKGITSGSGSAVGDRRRSGDGDGTRATPGARRGAEGAVGGLPASGSGDGTRVHLASDRRRSGSGEGTRATPGATAGMDGGDTGATAGMAGGGDTGAASLETRTGE